MGLLECIMLSGPAEEFRRRMRGKAMSQLLVGG